MGGLMPDRSIDTDVLSAGFARYCPPVISNGSPFVP
jgi:hypothetical protein